MSIEELQNLIQSRIKRLRPKLLDLSRRNPLISTSLTLRSNSLVRVVDGLPDDLAGRLHSQGRMHFIALPPLDEDPRDEQSPTFQNALSNARRSDETYLSALETVDSRGDGSIEAARRLERELRDRLRSQLGMAPRQAGRDVSLSQHAQNNHISASYELPSPTDAREDGRHSDEIIQTLFLPEDLERKLNALTAKCRMWTQETGINVLHAAFGFLEWSDQSGSDSAFAPLVLYPIEMEKKKTPEGAEFWVKATGDGPETNLVLAEKLRLDFSVDLPKYQGGSIEAYLQEVASASPKSMKWRVRRQVAFGVFPSARIAMYNDLDVGKHSYGSNEVVSKLFGGAGNTGATPFAEEYDIDHPDIEAKVPCLVMDADASQFSTLVDVAEGRNLAVEGPPGTGKSQTIVNTIAAALAAGKKVLFVAEKMAALEVVKSRLEAVGLGEFMLPLQAERSNREQVVQSLRNRLEMNAGRVAPDYKAKIERFKQTRAELAEYIDVISRPFGKCGITVYGIIGKSISGNHVLADLPKPLQQPNIPDVEGYAKSHIEILGDLGATAEVVCAKTNQAEPWWRGLTILNIDKFTVERVCDQTIAAAEKVDAVAAARRRLPEFGFELDADEKALELASVVLRDVIAKGSDTDADLVCRLSRSTNIDAIMEFLDACGRVQTHNAQMVAALRHPEDPEWPSKLREIFAICNEYGIPALDSAQWHQEIAAKRAELVTRSALASALKPFVEMVPVFVQVPMVDMRKVRAIVRETPHQALAVRSASNVEPTATTQLSRMCDRGITLQTLRQRLLDNFAAIPDATSAEISAAAGVLRGAGFFDRFGKVFGAARKYYVTHSKKSKFDRAAAAHDLQSLADWKAQAEEFGAGQQGPALFGAHFKGVDTDFSPFELLITFLERVDRELPGLGNRDIRDFLKTADLNLLIEIPDLPESNDGETFATLQDVIKNLQTVIAKADTDRRRFEGLIAGVIDATQTEAKVILPVAERIETLAQLSDVLDRHPVAREMLGDGFRGPHTDVEKIRSDVRLATSVSQSGVLSAGIVDLIEKRRADEGLHALQGVVWTENEARTALQALRSSTGVDFLSAPVGSNKADLAHCLRRAGADHDGIYAHSSYATVRADLKKQNVDWIVSTLEEYAKPLVELKAIIEAVIYRAMAMRVYSQHGSVLGRYPGEKLDERRALLAKLDREIIDLSRQHLRREIHHRARPPAGNGTGKKSTWTQLALIRNETSKTQRYIPLRDLTQRAGKALLELKPCWMMSPLAVAQYLAAGQMEFDLCIIDEASQMPPEDAVGALVRCKQAMIVGDTNQLPPTSFFRKMLDDDDADEDETVLEESILELANGTFHPARRLRWHYRSRHSALINFSNQHVYNGDLVVFPSASEQRPDMGVSLVSVDGRYKSGINAIEATTIVEAALQFMRSQPNRSLGIVTLNQKQRDLIQEEMQNSLNRDPIAAEYVEKWSMANDGLEEFFIKNLENVQGDERDVIFIGTVYGPETSGAPVMQRFGPINGVAGKRRLNVLFSRAKQQVITFSSMAASDVRAEENGNVGAYMLKRWLEYSVTGVIHSGETTTREPDSDFEIYVIEQLRAMGCEPVPQVGAAGYFIDIGVKHPMWPHGFIMAVECDGATYHSTRSARDRDRLRQEVLEGLGWHFHRIWSTDWFNDPGKEAEKLRLAINRRIDLLRSA